MQSGEYIKLKDLERSNDDSLSIAADADVAV